MNPEEVRAQSDGNRLRVARETGDAQTVDRLLRKFIELPNRDPDSMIEAVNDFEGNGPKTGGGILFWQGVCIRKHSADAPSGNG